MNVADSQGQLSLESLKRLDAVCAAYESAWRRDQPARIDDFLADAVEPERALIFRELLKLDAELRSKAGLSLPTEELRSRFPEYGELITGLESKHSADDATMPPRETPPDSHTIDTEATPSGYEDLPFLAPPTKPGSVGRLGHYHIQGVVGRGGMGVVLKAFDEKLHRIVAIKVLGPQFATNASARKRFEREAKAAAAVSHDHIVPIYHVDEFQGVPFLVMPLIVGKSLQDRLDQAGPVELKALLRIGNQIAEGLAAAHKKGLVHRDIKPGNILLENGVERVKITDFGLARAVDDASVTQSGVITGTPMYMAPEQARGEQVDHRADLFSLGSVLYAMCTGHPPFRATGTHAVLMRVIEDTPRSIRESNPELPDWLEAIIAKLHAKKPEDRFQTAKEVAELLEQHLAHLQQPHVAPKPATVTVARAADEDSRRALILEQSDRQTRWLQKALIAGSVSFFVVGFLITGFGRGHDGLASVGVILSAAGLGGFVALAGVKQRFKVRYRGHSIRCEKNIYLGESLFVDGRRVDRKRSVGWQGSEELRAVIADGEGAGDTIVAEIDTGLAQVDCRIFAEARGSSTGVKDAWLADEAQPVRSQPALWPVWPIAMLGIVLVLLTPLILYLFRPHLGAILAFMGLVAIAYVVTLYFWLKTGASATDSAAARGGRVTLWPVGLFSLFALLLSLLVFWALWMRHGESPFWTWGLMPVNMFVVLEALAGVWLFVRMRSRRALTSRTGDDAPPMRPAASYSPWRRIAWSLAGYTLLICVLFAAIAAYSENGWWSTPWIEFAAIIGFLFLASLHLMHRPRWLAALPVCLAIFFAFLGAALWPYSTARQFTRLVHDAIRTHGYVQANEMLTSKQWGYANHLLAIEAKDGRKVTLSEDDFPLEAFDVNLDRFLANNETDTFRFRITSRWVQDRYCELQMTASFGAVTCDTIEFRHSMADPADPSRRTIRTITAQEWMQAHAAAALPVPAARLPEAAAEVLPALVGAWKLDATNGVWNGKPVAKQTTGVAAAEWIAGKQFLRVRVQTKGGPDGIQIMAFDPRTQDFKAWIFDAFGVISGPSVGRWEPTSRTLTWTGLPQADTVGVKTLRFLDANTVQGEITFRNKAGNITLQVRDTMKRFDGPADIREDVAVVPAPPEMALLDRILGDWQADGVLKTASNPVGERFTSQLTSRKALGGRVIESWDTGLPGRDGGYSLAIHDPSAKAYRYWLWSDQGITVELNGSWDDAAQRIDWNGTPPGGGQTNAVWQWRGPDRREYTTVTRNAAGKAVFEIQATLVRRGAGVAGAGVIDLLALAQVDANKDARVGAWRLEQGRLVCERAPVASRASLALPAGPEEYDLEGVIERTDGDKGLTFGMWAQGKSFMVAVDAPILVNDKLAGPWSGITNVDDKSLNEPDNPTRKAGPHLVNGKRHLLRCQVRANGIAAMLDGKPLFDYRGGYERLLGSKWPREDAFFVFANGDSRFVIHRLQLMPPRSPLGTAPFDPDAPENVLNRLIGTWNFTSTIARPAAEKPAAGVSVVEPVAGGKFIRVYSTFEHGAHENLGVQTFDPAAGKFKGWFFTSAGDSHGPGEGVWDPARQTLTWREALVGDVDAVHEFRFTSPDAFDSQLTHKKASGEVVFELRSSYSRAKEMITPKLMPLDPKRPQTLKALDALAGFWRNDFILKRQPEPDKPFRLVTDHHLRPILAGHFFEAHEEDGDRMAMRNYWLIGSSGSGNHYRFWHFNVAGGHSALNGAWDEAQKKIRWIATDGSTDGYWLMTSPTERAVEFTANDGQGKFLFHAKGKGTKLPTSIFKASILKTFRPGHELLTTGNVKPDLPQNGWRIDSQGQGVVRLFELQYPGVDNCIVLFKAKLKTQKMEGGASLEMWARLVDQEFWSKGEGEHQVAGTTNWSEYQIPFRFEKGQLPNRLQLGLRLGGPGTVWIKDVEVTYQPILPFGFPPKKVNGPPAEADEAKGGWLPRFQRSRVHEPHVDGEMLATNKHRLPSASR
jgi:hypothetical protein